MLIQLFLLLLRTCIKMMSYPPLLPSNRTSLFFCALQYSTGKFVLFFININTIPKIDVSSSFSLHT